MITLGEYLRPWKLATLGVGIGLLIVGAFYYQAPDWDIPISLIMAACAYLTAPWSMRVIMEKRWRQFPLMLFFTWFSVDGCYAAYWSLQNPEALVMRGVNFPASLSLYWACGLIWYYRGTLDDLRSEVSSILASLRG